MPKINISTQVPITGYEPSTLAGGMPRAVYTLEKGIEAARLQAVKNLAHPAPEMVAYSVIADTADDIVWINSIWSV